MRKGIMNIGIAIFVVSLMFLHCIVTMKSVRDPGYNVKISKVYLYLKGAQDADKFFNSIGQTIKHGLSQHGVSSEYYVAGTLSLTSKTELRDKIKECNPDLIMEVLQTEYSTLNGAKSGMKLEVSLTPPGTDKPVWEGSLNSSTGGYGGMGIPSQIGEKIIDKLVEDGMIKLTFRAF